jgi:hypothetical protein
LQLEAKAMFADDDVDLFEMAMSLETDWLALPLAVLALTIPLWAWLLLARVKRENAAPNTPANLEARLECTQERHYWELYRRQAAMLKERGGEGRPQRHPTQPR